MSPETVRVRKPVLISLVLLVVGLGLFPGPVLSADRGPSGAGDDWTHPSADAEETRYSRLTAINSGNIDRLGLAWALDLPGEVSLEATPLAVHGILYFTGSYSDVYAVDAATGKILWKYAAELWKHNPQKMRMWFAVNRGVAYENGRIFSGTLDGRLLALDAATGKLLWSVQTVPPETIQNISGAPRVFKGKVIIGHGGGDYGSRGYVTAYDAQSGNQLWRFYTTPGTPEENKSDPLMERAAKTWAPSEIKAGPGGSVWDGITVDRDLNRIYIGTANAPIVNPREGRGDDLFTSSIVALDADTGKYLWHYQVNPHDAWDYDATQQMTLADLTIDGKPRKVLLQAPKNGFFYVIDRMTGRPISAGKTAKVTWADRIDLATGRPVETADIRFEKGPVTQYPSTMGAHNWHPMSFSPKTGLVYIPALQLGTRFTPMKVLSDLSNKSAPEQTLIMQDSVVAEPGDGKGSLLAWNPIAQQVRWRAPHSALWNGGTLATAGNLVFQGTADGYFEAYDAATGKRLWRFNAGLGIVAAPMSYAAGGRQYVSVLVGYGGTVAALSSVMDVGWKFGRQPRRLLTFGLDGKAVLPPSPPPDFTVAAVDDPEIKIDQGDVAAGAPIYWQCAICHGAYLHATGTPAPDLRESAIALNEDNLWAVVHDGELMQSGMPRFENLSRQQVHEIYAYIRAGAREVLHRDKPATN